MIRGETKLPIHLNRQRVTIDERGGGKIIRCKVAPDGTLSAN